MSTSSMGDGIPQACTDADPLLVDFACDETADVPDTVRTHVAGCDRCQTEIAALKGTRRAFARLPREEPRASMDARILMELEKHLAPSTSVTRLRPRGPARWQRAVAFASAASVLVAGAATLYVTEIRPATMDRSSAPEKLQLSERPVDLLRSIPAPAPVQPANAPNAMPAQTAISAQGVPSQKAALPAAAEEKLQEESTPSFEQHYSKKAAKRSDQALMAEIGHANGLNSEGAAAGVAAPQGSLDADGLGASYSVSRGERQQFAPPPGKPASQRVAIASKAAEPASPPTAQFAPPPPAAASAPPPAEESVPAPSPAAPVPSRATPPPAPPALADQEASAAQGGGPSPVPAVLPADEAARGDSAAAANAEQERVAERREAALATRKLKNESPRAAHERALAAWRAVLASDPLPARREDAMAGVVRELIALERFDEAVAAWDALVKAFPGHPDMYADIVRARAAGPAPAAKAAPATSLEK